MSDKDDEMLQLVMALSAKGWNWNPVAGAWCKNRAAITREALESLVSLHRWAIPYVIDQFDKSAYGFRIRIETTDDDVVAKFEWLRHQEENGPSDQLSNNTCRLCGEQWDEQHDMTGHCSYYHSDGSRTKLVVNGKIPSFVGNSPNDEETSRERGGPHD